MKTRGVMDPSDEMGVSRSEQTETKNEVDKTEQLRRK